jgi:hypothetical protein
MSNKALNWYKGCGSLSVGFFTCSGNYVDVQRIKRLRAKSLSSDISTTAHALAQEPRNSKFRQFLKRFGLLFFEPAGNKTLTLKSPIERRKVATHQSRRIAALNSLLHLVPLSGAITLLVLHWTKYWVGGSTDNRTTLQFVAKLYELLAQASLVDLLVYVIRAQALEGYIPLGALSGAAQAPQLSYLWSLDFISAIRAPTFTAWQKTIFGLSSMISLSIAATIGPSTAVLMIPQPTMPKFGNTVVRYLNVSEDVLFPRYMSRTSGLDL